jgi:hypothetical protein
MTPFPVSFFLLEKAISGFFVYLRKSLLPLSSESGASTKSLSPVLKKTRFRNLQNPT